MLAQSALNCASMQRLPAFISSLIALLTIGCGSTTAPSAQTASPTGSVQIGSPSPALGSTIPITVGAAPGFFIPRGSGQISIPITVTADQQLPWAQLFVYLMTGDGPQDYCGQNLPDTPGWEPFTKNQTTSVTVTGFQVFRLPCDVVAIRAYLTTRDTRHGGTLSPPTSIETIASGTIAASYQLRQ